MRTRPAGNAVAAVFAALALLSSGCSDAGESAPDTDTTTIAAEARDTSSASTTPLEPAPADTVLVTPAATDTISTAATTLPDATDPSTTAWVCAQYPERVRMLFRSFDLERPGLEAVAGRVAEAQWVRACDALLHYYRTGSSGSWLRREKPAFRPGRYERADKALADSIYVSYVYTRMPRREAGGVDWTFSGPEDTREYRSQFTALIHVSHIYDGYLRSGDPKYARRIDADVRDWILANPYPGPGVDGIPWQGLWAAQRVKYFGEWFYGLMAEPAFTDATRILMLASLVEHADLLRYHHLDAGNRLVSEMDGLARVAVLWPELNPAGEWVHYTTGIMRRELAAQVYPDGTQFELTSHYHTITANQFQSFMELLAHAGHDAGDMRGVVEQLWDYVAYSMRPDGTGVMNNDGFENFNRPRLLELAPFYGRDDWVYIASNGARGTQPEWEPSVFYEWAGQAVMRSGWDANALWAYFEFGPSGQAHWHWDKLHLSVFAHGRPLLVDNGLYHYADTPWWRYFRETSAHNVIMVDGKGQKLWEKTTEAALDPSHWRPGADTEVARGTMDAFRGVQGRAVHHRAVTHVRGEYWLVVDRIETDRPRDLTTLWHFHPECTVEMDGDDAVSVDPGKGNLRIVPVGPVAWTQAHVRGSDPPDVQGWYSPKPNNKLPATVALYEGRIESTTTFAWVLYPARGVPEKPAARFLPDGRVEVRTRAGVRTLATGLE